MVLYVWTAKVNSCHLSLSKTLTYQVCSSLIIKIGLNSTMGRFMVRWNFSLLARCSLLFARRSLLLLVVRCSLLFARCSLLFARCLLLFTRCSARSSEDLFLSKSKQKKFSILICTKSLICDNLKTRIFLNWRLSAIFMSTKDKIPWKFSV